MPYCAILWEEIECELFGDEPVKGPDIVRGLSAGQCAYTVVITVSAPIHPRGSIFQNEVLDGNQFKSGPKKIHFHKNLFFLLY